MGTFPTASLVRIQDRLSFGRDERAVWRINPRTGFLEARAGLSWTGVREYRTGDGVVRVLRRPEQVNSRGHLRTLRLLPATEGHPAGDVNVNPANEAELRVGTVGDQIDVESLNGYLRPVGNVSVSRPSTIAKMVDDATWADYCERFPDLARLVHRDGGPPATGTSLGYNALWFEPHVEDEIRGDESSAGGLWGEWLGPNGPEPYDVEHVVDPDCALVLELAAHTGFDPAELGANHYAIALPELGGRGGAQSELLRIVDSIAVDRTGTTAIGAVQVPVHEALIASPNTEVVAVVDTSPQIEARVQDQVQEPKRMKTLSIEVGLGRDAFSSLAKSGALLGRLSAKKIAVPQSATVLVPVSDEIDPKELGAKLGELQAFVVELVELVGESMGEAEAAKAELEDSVPKEEMAKAIAAKEAELAELKAAMAEAEKTADAVKAERDSLVAEVEPLRAKELAELRAEAVVFGIEGTKVADASASEIRRMVVVSKLGDVFGKVSDDVVSGALAGLRLGVKETAKEPDPSASVGERNTAAPFTRIPQVSVAKATDKNESADDSTISNDAAPSWRDGLIAAGG